MSRRMLAWTIILFGFGLMVATILLMPNTAGRTALLLIQAACVLFATVTRP